MDKVTILGKDFAVTDLKVTCVNAQFFSVQAWSNNRIYSLSITQSDIVNKSYDDLLNDINAVCEGSSMRGANVNHVAVVDTNLRKAILAKMLKTENDLQKAIEENDTTFFASYDKLVIDLYLNKLLNVCKVTLDIATLTNGTHTTYKSVIGENVTTATSRDVFDFKTGIQKTALSAAADILSAIEDEEEDEEE